MDIPQAQIPHRMVTGDAGHVAKRTEVKAVNPVRNTELRTLLRGVKGARQSDGYGTGRRSFQRSDNFFDVKRSDNCSNCGATNTNSVGSHSGAESDADDSIHRRWASSTDIFRAYSDPMGGTAGTTGRKSGTGSLRGNSLRISPNQSKPRQQVRFASVRGPPRNSKLKNWFLLRFFLRHTKLVFLALKMLILN